MRRIHWLSLAILLSCGASAQTLPLGTQNLSGSITTGGTFQTLDAASSRQSFEFQNICNVAGAGACVATTDNCYLNVNGAATPSKANSILVTAGSYYGRMTGVVPGGTIQVTCDGTGDKFLSQKQGQ